MIQSIRDDVILGSENGRYRARIRREAGLETHASFGLLKLRNPMLQFQVQAHGARYRPYRARTSAILLRRLDLRLDQPGMIGESEVVIAGEINYFAAIKARDGLASGLEHAQPLIRSSFAPCFELLAQIAERFSGGHRSSTFLKAVVFNVWHLDHLAHLEQA